MECDIIKLGEDYNISLYGGDKAHIGSVVLAIPRESLTGQGISVTSSVLNCMGHKDEVLAKMFAEKTAISKQAKVVCACGVHIDDINEEQLQNIIEMSKELLQDVLASDFMANR